MGPAPPIAYTKAGRFHIAYQVVGDGPFDLVYSPSWFSNLELWWEEPAIERVFRRLASFSRLILFDRRGTGLSDPVGLDWTPTLDDRVEDHLAVMDAVGSERAAILASGASGQLGLYVAATHPERTSALVLHNSTARLRRADDFPIGAPDHVIDRYIEEVGRRWGTDVDPLILGARAPRSWGRLARQAMGPGAALAAQRFNADSDLRAVLPSVRVPTLVLHGLEAPVIRVEHGRYLAAHIPTARLVELPGRTDLFTEGEAALDEAQEFLTGSRLRLDADLVLATVLFTDIADSTARMSAAGDQKWREVIDEHDMLVRRALARHRGQEIKTLGDGFLAVFDGVVRAIECAAAIESAAAELDIEVRAGIHTGECVRRGADVTGMAVNIASRIQACATGGEVLVSQTVRDLVVGSPLRFEDRGPQSLKGVPGEWRLFAYQA